MTEFKFQDFKEIKSFIGAEGCIDRYIPISVSVVESPTAEWRIRVEKPFCMTRWHYVSKEVSLFYFFIYSDLTEDLSTRILDNKVLRKRLVVPFSFIV